MRIHVLRKVTLYLSFCCQRSCQHKIHDKLNQCSIISTCEESARKNKRSSPTWPAMLGQLAQLGRVALATAVLTDPTQQPHRSRGHVAEHNCISKHSIGALATELASYIVCVVFLRFQTLPVWAIPKSVLKAKAQTLLLLSAVWRFWWIYIVVNEQIKTELKVKRWMRETTKNLWLMCWLMSCSCSCC